MSLPLPVARRPVPRHTERPGFWKVATSPLLGSRPPHQTLSFPPPCFTYATNDLARRLTACENEVLAALHDAISCGIWYAVLP